MSTECSDELHKVRICACHTPGTMINSGLDIMDGLRNSCKFNLFRHFNCFQTFKLQYIETMDSNCFYEKTVTKIDSDDVIRFIRLRNTLHHIP
jgi:hypothetical protein